MQNPITPELIRKYLEGTCSPEESSVLHQWYDSFEDQNDPFTELSIPEQEALKLAMINKFKASLLIKTKGEINQAKINKVPISIIYAISAIAAVFLMVFGFNFFNQNHLYNGSKTTSYTAEKFIINNLTKSIYKQKLADGSIVWLSPKSQLEFPKKFTGATREVKMSGEAFFEVSKDHNHPFIIYSGGVITRVWGTSFRIRAFKNKLTEVSVVTGKVSVKIPEKNNSEIMLFPAQEVTYVKKSALLKKAQETKSSSIRLWQKATLSFDNVAIDRVLNTLQSKFDISIYTNDLVLSKFLLKADFTDLSLPAILDILENSLNTTYTISDNEIVLYRKKPIAINKPK